MAKLLIVNADDFGLSPGVNRGIAEAYAAGGVTSASMMVNMPGFWDAVSLAKLHPGLGTGLHFNLTYGKPVSEPRLVPSLVNSAGQFLGIRSSAAWTDTDIETELAAQWDRFASTGLRPTHLDSHHLLHQNIPSVFRIMAVLAERELLPMRRSQMPVEPSSPPIWTTDNIWLDTYHEKDGLQRLLRYLHELPDGSTEIMCHPGYSDEILRGLSEWTEVREAEQAVFCHPSVLQTIRALGIIPIHYGMLTEKPRDQAPAPVREETSVDRSPSVDPVVDPVIEPAVNPVVNPAPSFFSPPLEKKPELPGTKERKKRRSSSRRRRRRKVNSAGGRRRYRRRKG